MPKDGHRTTHTIRRVLPEALPGIVIEIEYLPGIHDRYWWARIRIGFQCVRLAAWLMGAEFNIRELDD